MKKDINFEKVEDVAIAVVPEEEVWVSYLVNLKKEKLENVIVSTKGYGTIDGKKVETSVLRHMFEQVEPNSFVKIEPIQKKLTALSNEFWLSFFIDGEIQDKKYVFVTESITEQNLTEIPVLNERGIMIK